MLSDVLSVEFIRFGGLQRTVDRNLYLDILDRCGQSLDPHERVLHRRCHFPIKFIEEVRTWHADSNVVRPILQQRNVIGNRDLG